jgi:hypothetical protein
MKKIYFVCLIAIIVLLGGYIIITKNNIQPVQQQSENQTTEITRKAELELEGFINDYFYRRQIKDSFLFGDFNAYGSVLAKSIVVYVYPNTEFLEALGANDLPQGRAEDIKEMIKKDLQEQLFDFPGFEWTKEYSLDVVVR